MLQLKYFISSKISLKLYVKHNCFSDKTLLEYFSQEKQNSKNKPQMNENKLQRRLEIHWASFPKLIS